MKSLYVWNDLACFLDVDCAKVEAEVRELFGRLSGEPCQYRLVTAEEHARWAERSTRGLSGVTITIGARPTRMLPCGASAVHHVPLQRRHASDGSTAEIRGWTQERIERLRSEIDADARLHVIEDVIVTGSTMRELRRGLRAAGHRGEIQCDALCANRRAAEQLRGAEGIHTRAEVWMEGEPLRESTLVCLHDLIFGDLGGRPFRVRDDLLQRFLFGETSRWMAWAQSYFRAWSPQS